MVQLLNAEGALLVGAVGLLLICAEFCLPGWVWPGVLGGVCVICGVHRLAANEASLLAASGLTILVLAAGSLAYGTAAPAWVSWLVVALIPVSARQLVPGEIGWPAALSAAIPAATMSVLLRIRLAERR